MCAFRRHNVRLGFVVVEGVPLQASLHLGSELSDLCVVVDRRLRVALTLRL